MFYSIELLHRKASLGLVWLAGTKGRRLTKLNVLETDVAEACHTILNPPVVLALRLQSTLLLGTVVILNRQADYLAEDVDKILKKIQYAQDSILSNTDDHCASFSAITLPECEGEPSTFIEQIPDMAEMSSVSFPLDPSLLVQKNCPSPTVARPDDLLLPEVNFAPFEQFDENEDISIGALGDLGLEGENPPGDPSLSFDHFNQIEESDADESRILREELEKRCEEDQGQGFHAQWEPVGELLPLAQRSHKKPKRAVVDQKLTLTDSELRSWFQDTSSITKTPKFNTCEEELREEKIRRGCPAFNLFGAPLHSSLMELYSAPPPEVEEEHLRQENQFRGDEGSTLDAELNAKIFVADHFGVSMDELFGGEMDFQDNSIHPLREGEEDTMGTLPSIELSQLSAVKSTPQLDSRSPLLGDTPQQRSTPLTLRNLDAFSPIHPQFEEAPESPEAKGREERNRIIDTFDSTTFQFLNFLRMSSPLGKGNHFAMQSLIDQIAGDREKKPVAARTFYQVLVLASSGFLEVHQDRPYRKITLEAGEAL